MRFSHHISLACCQERHILELLQDVTQSEEWEPWMLFEQPYCRISNLVEAGIVGRQAASRYLKELASIGVLVEHAVGREKLFTHPRLLDLLTSETHEAEPYV